MTRWARRVVTLFVAALVFDEWWDRVGWYTTEATDRFLLDTTRKLHSAALHHYIRSHANVGH